MTSLARQNPKIILHSPQMAENVGLAARAMKNCGFSELIIVAPKFKKFSKKALTCATSGADILKNAKICKTFSEAASGLSYLVATTARPRELNLPVSYVDDFIAKATKHKSDFSKMGIIFGCERCGLDNDVLSLCDEIITLPAAEFASFNLAASVLLVAHAFFKKKMPAKSIKTAEIADKPELFAFYDFLNSELNEYYNRAKDKGRRMQNNLQNIFNRAGLSKPEIKSLYGAIKALKKGL